MDKPTHRRWPDRRSDVINLCFHGVGVPGRSLEPEEDEYWVAVTQFDEILGAIDKNPAVRITFDDGNASDVVHAMPALLEHGLHATFFVVAGRLDQPGSLAASDVQTLVRSGMTVGSHGMLHRPWRSLSDDALRMELADSTSILEQVVGGPIREVACPFGSYDRRVLRAIRRHGFAHAYTVDGAAARREAWLQSRYTVRRYDTPTSIASIVRAPRGGALRSAVREGKTFIKRMR
jgi:peptidoglycan/xylan/chitin deacetylase (PgdA/CDA1 family)